MLEQINFKLWSKSGGLAPGLQEPNRRSQQPQIWSLLRRGSSAPALTSSNGETEAWKLSGLASESRVRLGFSLVEPNPTHAHEIPAFGQPWPEGRERIHSRRNTATGCFAPSAQEPLPGVVKMIVFSNHCAFNKAQRHQAAFSTATCPFPSSLGPYVSLQHGFCCSCKIRS